MVSRSKSVSSPSDSSSDNSEDENVGRGKERSDISGDNRNSSKAAARNGKSEDDIPRRRGRTPEKSERDVKRSDRRIDRSRRETLDRYDPSPPRRHRETERSRHESRHRSPEKDDDRRGRDRYRRGNDDRSRYRRHRDAHSSEDERDRSRRDRRRQEEKDAPPAPEPQPTAPPKPDSRSRTETAKDLSKTGGVYIPPFKLAQMMKEVDDKNGLEYQRMTWDALKKSINGLVNKVNASNVKNILPELFAENLVRGRGLFARSCMKSQMASPTFTHVFAALVAVINTKFPDLGELLLSRIILQFRRAFKRNDKPILLATTRFIAHLVNQQVASEVLALELLVLLLEEPTDDSVEVAVGFMKECGAMLQDVSPTGLHVIFERFRAILHEGEIDKRVQFTIEGLFAIRKAKFAGQPAVVPELDLVEQEQQITHTLSLQDSDLDPQTALDIFKFNPNFAAEEQEYEKIKKEILGEESDGEGSGEEGSRDEESEDEESEDEEAAEERMMIQDETETNLVNLRRTIYLTIMASVDFEEAGHKLMKIKLEPGQEMELCVMLLECCSQERTYLRYYGLLGERFCLINRVYQENFETCFVKQYSMIHRLETSKLRNVAKFFAHLLGRNALPWDILSYFRLTEEDTSSSARIFIKIIFQELSEHLGLRGLNERLSDPTMEEAFTGIFPRDSPKNARFAINFFTSIGLGGITDGLREFLKNMPKLIMQQQQAQLQEPKSDSDESSDEDDSSSDGTDSESGSGSGSSSESGSESESSDGSESSDSESESESESESDRERRKKKKQRKN